MKTVVILICMLMVTVGGFTMIETISTEDLITQSDIIIIGRVVKIEKADAETQAQFPPELEVLFNTISVSEHLTNSFSTQEIIITTFKGFEDDIEFKEQDNHLLFLKKQGDKYIVFNSPQGSYLIDENNNLSGMVKDGVTIKSAREKIKQLIK